jgi:acylphosphatase
MPTIHLVIIGQVQGVFYRATAKEIADKIGVKGWVKNTPAGNVEIRATGTEDELKQFVDWCRKGPRKAVVEDVKETAKEEEKFARFEIIR